MYIKGQGYNRQKTKEKEYPIPSFLCNTPGDCSSPGVFVFKVLERSNSALLSWALVHPFLLLIHVVGYFRNFLL